MIIQRLEKLTAACGNRQ